MRYPYFDILVNMAKANVVQTETLHNRWYRDSIILTKLGPTLESKTFYTTPEGDLLIDDANGGTRYA